MSTQELFKKRALDLTAGEFAKVIIHELQEASLINATKEETYSFKGIKGIMEIFQCSKSKAVAIRASGIIDDACIQNGNSFLIDRRTALNLMKNNADSRSHTINK